MVYRTLSYAANTWDVFWYEKNLQGDIIAVYNSSGTKLVSYNYSDAWGNYTVSYANGGGSTGATYNPFKYRGYYFDTDLGMYYLQSRYYDAKICRFLNADIYVSTGQGVIGFNMFAYCRNQSPTRVDDEGTVDQDCVSDEDILDESWQDGKGAGGSGPTGTNSSGSAGNGGGCNSYAQSTSFVPSNYWQRNAPKYATPSSTITFNKYNSYTNKVETSTVFYDFAGRQTFRIDYTDHGRPSDHTNPHSHMYLYNGQYPEGKKVK